VVGVAARHRRIGPAATTEPRSTTEGARRRWHYTGCRLDLLVADRVVVEVKVVDQVTPIREAQLLTYLRLSGRKSGLLLNFRVKLLRDGITRRVL
jgi:GxxExxY protein